MKFYSFKYKLFYLVVCVALACLDIFMMCCWGFHGQLLIALYAIIGLVSVYALLFAVGNVVPSIVLNDMSGTLVTNGIYDERRNATKSFATIHLDEVLQCQNDRSSIVLTMKWNRKKILYLSAFSNFQILRIKKEIDRRLTQSGKNEPPE